jgi:simple sugar transport system substrate-binding protein
MKKTVFKIVVMVMSLSLLLLIPITGCQKGPPKLSAASGKPVIGNETVLSEIPSSSEPSAAAETTAKKNPADIKIVMVYKLAGLEWFDNMDLGIAQFAKDYGVTAYGIGPTTADPAGQVAMVEDLIAKGVDAILCVPNDAKAMEPVFKKANDAGILTFTHESSIQKQVSWDVEAFDNVAYGKHEMDYMAEAIGKKGEYATSVGMLTCVTHNEWIDGALAQQKEKYPDMKCVVERFEVDEDQNIAYQKALEILKGYPNIRAFLGSPMSTVPGVCNAIEEKGLIGKVTMYGTCIPSVAKKYLESGSCGKVSFWIPYDAGYVTALVAYKTLMGEPITEGMDLKRPGYESVKIKDTVVYGQAWYDVDKTNMDEFKL